MTAALYARVSTAEQAEKLLPIADQLAACRDLCQARGWPIGLERTDDGISGSVWPRPGLAAILEAARRKEIQTVVVWNYQRIGRDENLELFGHLLWEFRQAGAAIVSIKEPDASAIEVCVQGMVAGLQLQKIRQDIERGMRSKAARCEYTGGRRLFGYRWISKTDREIIPEEAAVVARVFELADPEGGGARLIDISRETGIERQRVLRMLRHPGYAGAYTYSRRTFGGKRGASRPAPLGRQVIRWGAHEPIVPRDRWDRVQARLDQQAQLRPNNHGAATLPLTGILRCGTCQRPLRVSGAHTSAAGTRYYYRCPVAGCQGVGNVCVAGWPASIMAALAQELQRPELAEAIAAVVNRAYGQGRRRGAHEAEVRRLERAEATLREVMRSGEVSDTRALARDYEATVRALTAARASLAHDREAVRPLTPEAVRSRLQQAAARLLELGQSSEAELAARSVLARYVDGIVVQPRRVTVQLARGLVETSKALSTRDLRSFRFDLVRERGVLVAA